MSIISRTKHAAMRRSRDRKLEHFYSLCPTEAKILDVGVSAESRPSGPHRNYFLRTFRYPPQFYCGLGVEDIQWMSEKYHGMRFVQYSGGKFPFEDKQFEWVYSNAVIEHVGSREKQIQFVNEMMRVARRVFFTTPYKFFPVESHTNILFLHWFDEVFFRYARIKRPWLNRDILNLLSYRRLDEIMRASNAKEIEISRNRLFGLTMTLTVVCSA